MTCPHCWVEIDISNVPISDDERYVAVAKVLADHRVPAIDGFYHVHAGNGQWIEHRPDCPSGMKMGPTALVPATAV